MFLKPPAARNPCLLCSLVLMVSRGNRETSTAVPANPPDMRDVRKLTSVILLGKTLKGYSVIL